jgi:polysaccharide pyruvyl transferase WcaK-like protein
MSYIYIKGNYGNGNVGDNAIAYCIYKKIYERGNKTYLLSLTLH